MYVKNEDISLLKLNLPVITWTWNKTYLLKLIRENIVTHLIILELFKISTRYIV